MISLETSTMQLIGGDLDGIRICRVEGESLVTSVIPRDNLLEAKQLPDIPPRGICYLLDEDHGNLNRVYTGQTTQGVTLEDNLEFNSPSATAVFTLGGRRNGWTEWINNNGDTLDALYRKGME
ncbi:DUF4357 domain-containing protein [Actinomycetaceae bacterium UMB8039B]|uniref:DUF4357 domain-containing protein n=1 Tax=unclassified Pauljensenia TaxID=2908895 RepID=UPI00254F3C0A|nr:MULTISPECIES: DUF4357 domain-containing protein [unclassified Pauljensenia]MDK7781330.1 DUF4357 domain-containing protein [Actinomycetaceae bacterium UMB8041B]MDK8294074.1 DUF4357 domain-containing protein [Actinomycetaceae bacterium UMB8039B]MDK8608999.1 DUF4357 domain-containing protein [Actinomycetaceae bacterium UMB8041A]MDK8753428.1 DUF4357 domain-containing protein [Actinomycetaceae bacterium UMB8039A]MDK6830825.1 DUF4357 domain-containing protein [Pauljensenia sp. UMB8040A]